MKKIYGLVMGILMLTFILTGVGCATSEASTPTVTPTPTEDINQIIAANFLKNSSTFKFDGIEGSLKYVKTEPGWAAAFPSTAYTFKYQTQHPGHGDRTGQALDQVITNHTAVVLVNTQQGTVALAICDKTWDMVHEKNPPQSVIGTVISGGDTTQPGGPMDAPRIFVYQVRKADRAVVNVRYTAYPPSPVGEAARAKITLEFSGGTINMGDTVEALGTLDKDTNTITVADQGDYIKSYPAQTES